MRNPDRETTFHFKQFELSNCHSAMKVGTDGVLLGAWSFAGSANPAGHHSILDVGCGTGLLMLMMAQRFPEAQITGIEIDPAAAREATANCVSSPWGTRLHVACDDFCRYAVHCENGSFDMIISNPPFFCNGALAPDMNRRAARHEGNLNVDTLIEAAADLLHAGGKLAIVLPAEFRSRLEFSSCLHGLILTRLCLVKTVEHKPARRLLAELVKPGAGTAPEIETTELIIKKAGNIPSDDYSRLVSPFYLKI